MQCEKCPLAPVIVDRGIAFRRCNACGQIAPDLAALEAAVVSAAMAYHELLGLAPSVQQLSDADDALEAACCALKKARGAQ